MATPEDLAETTVKEVEALGRRIVARKADVRDAKQLPRRRRGRRRAGRLDVVVANAGICPTGNQDIQAFFDTIDVDFMGVQNARGVDEAPPDGARRSSSPAPPQR